ncbi:MAG: hypothetical protein A3I02_09195 [Betaproteobacteria bacterium RIFCSPLOWO2_02_FULL_67_26]|nr:MAG: hypothetical protein A3I02_09195 [Betaproteobacteria bacterium RIFCSPLOWO2_02_FULL_67_26]
MPANPRPFRILKARTFARWTKREGLADGELAGAVSEMKEGLIDARLGGGVFKKRIAKRGQGKSGGYRMILASNLGDRWVFMFGFAKNERDNIDDKELKLIKDLASVYLAMDEPMLKRAITAGELVEIRHGKQETA